MKDKNINSQSESTQFELKHLKPQMSKLCENL